jgi:hypothetical protein
LDSSLEASLRGNIVGRNRVYPEEGVRVTLRRLK